MSGDFEDREGVALVLGASGGIGRAIADTLLEAGCDVALTYRTSVDKVSSSLARAAQLGRKAQVWQLDLQDAGATADVVHDVGKTMGGIHTLVHAAGPHVPMRHLSTVEPADLQAQIEADIVAFFNAVRPAIPLLRASRGNIVAVTTAATSRFPVRDGLSAVPKGAVDQLVRALAAEEGRYGVRVNAVGPGMLTDGMAERLIESGDLDETALAVTRRNIPLRRFGTARDVAEAVAFLASDRAQYITGQKLNIDGGYSV